MTFLRPGHDGTFASPSKNRKKSRRVCGLLTLFSLSAASLTPGTAKPKPKPSSRPFKPVGVKAWTSGSQTYIRARPGIDVPVVAKVARHMPLYVWGKYNGWYRVETHDHIFGWVYNPYLNGPGLDKVREMPHSTARLASDRTANQIMFGTPQVLKKHVAVYGAPGAVKGLKQHGVYLAVEPKPKPVAVASKPKAKVKPLVAAAPKPAVKPVSTVQVTAAKPRLRERIVREGIVRERVAVAPAVKPVVATKPVAVSPVPVVEAPVRTVRETTPSVSKPIAPAQNRETRVVAATVKAAPIAPRAVESEKIAGASRALMPSARQFARAAEMAARPSPSGAMPAKSSDLVRVAPQKSEVSTPLAAAPPRAIAVAKPKPKKTVAKKAAPRKVAAKKTAQKRVTSSPEQRRQQLRSRMGLSPAAVPTTMIAPVSPDELLRAREEHLNRRRQRLESAPPTASTAPLAPVSGLAPLPPSNLPLGGPLSQDSPPAEISPASFENDVEMAVTPLIIDGDTHPLQPLLDHPYVVALAQLKPKATTAQPAVAARGGSPRDRAPLNRSGSPRDRMGTGMASQALSYRGMRYVRGSASPNRGFDCSGLIYYLLRQRGYNPPRMASGYRNWGTSVPRGELQPGDLVLFANTYKRGISHIGVYLGENKFVHAATSRTGVRVSSLSEAYYAGKYYGARRAK
ncbi:MAG: C40 family peptidase [Armatimonadetes bacterium]|nr:C40 family peptidase [Armatimonadota bacterium]